MGQPLVSHQPDLRLDPPYQAQPSVSASQIKTCLQGFSQSTQKCGLLSCHSASECGRF